jgi:hypothetical protein
MIDDAVAEAKAERRQRGALSIAFAMNRGKSKLQPKQHNGVQVEPSEQDADHFFPANMRATKPKDLLVIASGL